MYHDHPELFGPVWSWTVETGNTHCARCSAASSTGFPTAKLFLGKRCGTTHNQLINWIAHNVIHTNCIMVRIDRLLEACLSRAEEAGGAFRNM